MITDRELDAQLAGAAGIRDADLPALPEDFLGLVTADAPGDDAGGVPASLVAARQLVDDARDARTAPRPRRRRPGRKAVLRAGMAVIAVAAAWLTAVVVAPSDRPATRDDAAAPSEVPPTADGITLVAAEEVTFPLSLDPAPEGLTPFFSRIGGVGPFAEHPLAYTADYRSDEGDGFTLWLHQEDPRTLENYFHPLDNPEQTAILETGTVSIDGSQAELIRGSFDTGSPFANLVWERPGGQWVQILGDGAYAETAAVVAVAESLVDRPQPVGLQFGLAPAGWSLVGYEESRSIDLTSDADPQQLLRLSVYPPAVNASVYSVLDGMDLAGPVIPVTVQGQPARLALAKGDEGYPDYWIAEGQLPNGSRFLMLAPQVLTQDQVLEIADQVTYTP